MFDLISYHWFISQQQMSAMQRVEESQTSLKVPKLKLKLTQPFQNPVESEQSSTESESDNENEHYDDENISTEQDNLSFDVGSNDKQVEIKQPSFIQSDDEMQHYPYDTSNSNTININTNNSFDESLNESGSSAKNTSTDSDGKSSRVEGSECFIQTPQQYLSAPPQEDIDLLNQLQIISEIQSDQAQNINIAQTNIALESITNINVSCS